MTFPKNSAFGQHDDMVRNAMEQAAGEVKVEPGLEPYQRVGMSLEPNMQRHVPDQVTIPQAVYEEWLYQLEGLSDMRGGEEIGYIVDQMRSHLPG